TVVNDHTKFTKTVVISYGAEGIVQAVVVGGEGVGNIKVEGHINILQVSGINGGAAFLGLNNNWVAAFFGAGYVVGGIAGIPLIAAVAGCGFEGKLLFEGYGVIWNVG